MGKQLPAIVETHARDVNMAEHVTKALTAYQDIYQEFPGPETNDVQPKSRKRPHTNETYTKSCEGTFSQSGQWRQISLQLPQHTRTHSLTHTHTHTHTHTRCTGFRVDVCFFLSCVCVCVCVCVCFGVNVCIPRSWHLNRRHSVGCHHVSHQPNVV